MKWVMCHKKALFVATCAFVASICGINFVSAEAPNSSSLDFSVNVNETVLEMDISSNNISLDLTPIGGAGVFDKKDITVTVGTNNPDGYNLSMVTQSVLTRDGALSNNTTPTISTLSSAISENDFKNSSDSISRWGYKIADGNYSPVKNGLNLLNFSDTPTNSVATTVSFGAKTVPHQAAGTYTGDVNFVTVANVEPWYYMQEVDNWAKSVAVGETVKAVDARTGTTYDVIRINPRRLFMKENLKVPAGMKMTSADSDITPNATYSSFTMPTEEWTSSSQNYYCKAIMKVVDDQYFYNWYAAKANPYECSDPTSNANATATNDNYSLGSICPAGWTLSSTSYVSINDMWNNGANPGNLDFPGHIENGTIYGSQSTGFWWQSNRSNNSNATIFYLYSGSNPYSANWNKSYGLAMRCMSKYEMRYTVTFDPAGGEVTDPIRTVTAGFTASSLIGATGKIGIPVPTRQGYLFRGWYTETEGGEIINENTQITADNTTYYAHWEPVSVLAGVTYMQDFATLSEAEYANILNSMVINKPYSIKDKRDEKTYAIAKMSNGRLFMLENLKLSNTNTNNTTRVLDSTDSDIAAGQTYTMPTTAWTNGSQNYFCKGMMATADGEYYYNWYAAKANPYECNNPTSNTNATAVNDYKSLGSICPAGWTLPTYNELTPEILWDNGNNPGALYYTKGFVSGAAQYLMGGGDWQSANRFNETYSYALAYSSAGPMRNNNFYKFLGLSVRCMNGPVNKYTITFNANGGTPTTTTQEIIAGDPVVLPETSPTKQDSQFTGWFTAATGGEQINSSTIPSGNVTYYAQWVASIPTYMQDFASLSSTEKNEILNSMPTNSSYSIKDARDEKEYHVAKMSNGRVYMLETLKLDSRKSDNTVRVLTSADSDITPNSTYSSFTMPTTTWSSASQNYQCRAIMAISGGQYFYNWYAAKANPYACSDNQATTARDNYSLGSICPAGWTLPNYSTDVTPAILYNNGANPAQLTAEPGYFRSGTRSGAGAQGNLWGSMRNGDKWSYFLFVDKGNANFVSLGYNDKDHGFGVRCLLK